MYRGCYLEEVGPCKRGSHGGRECVESDSALLEPQVVAVTRTPLLQVVGYPVRTLDG